MHFPNLPTPDDIVKLFLHIIPLPGIALLGAYLVWWLYGWYKAIKDAAEAARTGAGFIRNWIARISVSTPQVTMIAFLASILLLIAQASWIAFSFIVGNVISADVGVNHGLHTLMLHAGNGLTAPIIPTWSQFASNLRLDAVSGIYVGLSIAAIIRTYVRARGRRQLKSIGWLFTAPAYFYGILGLLGGAIGIILNITTPILHDNDHVSSSLVAFFLCLGVLGTIYVLACRLLARAPMVVADMWTRRNTV